MKSVTFTGLVALCLVVVPACAPENINPPAAVSSALAAGTWSLQAITTRDAHPERSIVAGRLTLAQDHTWTIRYDYHLAATSLDQLWSSGLSGTWEAQPGEPVAVRFTVLDDHSSAVATIPVVGHMEVTLMGLQMRFERVPD